jgi:pimeloyl-ACP methyl ester carboxylesterase
VARAAGFAGTPVRLVVGADDNADAFLHPAEHLRDALTAGGTAADLHVIEGMGHALAEEPGLDPAPQTAPAARVDALAVAWLGQALELA